MEKALQLRHELAQMLDKPSHADFVLERRMAKESKAVLDFLKNLATKLKVKGEQNLKELLELKREELDDSTIKTVDSHDWRYYENLLKKKKHQIDTQLIKEYFPLNVVCVR